MVVAVRKHRSVGTGTANVHGSIGLPCAKTGPHRAGISVEAQKLVDARHKSRERLEPVRSWRRLRQFVSENC